MQRHRKRLVRLCDAFQRKGQQAPLPCSASTGHRLIAAKLLPTSFKIGPNCTVLDLDEVDEVLSARAAGADDEATRRLVRDIEQRRRTGGQ